MMTWTKHPKLIVSMAAVVLTVLISGVAFAAWGPRNVGYFHPQTDAGSDYGRILQNGLTPIMSTTRPTKLAFINYISGLLGGRTQYSGSTQDQVGAAFIIQTMIGKPMMTNANYHSWPNAKDIQDWKDSINSQDIVLDVYTNFDVPNGQNSGYSTSMKDDAWIITQRTTSVLVFKNAITGKPYYYLKIDCANAVGDMPGLPPPPVVKGYKVDTNGSMTGQYSADTINATSNGSVTASDSGQPFNIPVQSGTVVVAPANGITGWTVTGYSYTPCNTVSGACAAVVSGNAASVTFTAKDGYTYDMKWVYAKSVVNTSPCPSLPNPPYITVPLPDQTPGPQSPPPAYTTTANSPYQQNTPKPATNVTSIQDISLGGNRVLPLLKSQSYQQAVLDYTPYINAYSYDNNQPSVTYNTTYTITYWRSAASPSGYTCPRGGSLSGSTCSTLVSTQTWVAPVTTYSPGTPYTCYIWDWNRWPPKKVRTTCYTQGSITTIPGHWITTTTTSSYAAQPIYNYSVQSTSPNQVVANTVPGQLMTECFLRGFSVSAVNAASSNVSLNNYENPTSAAAGGYTASVRFSYTNVAPGMGLRQPMKANLTYSYKFANGSATLCSGNNVPFTVTGGYGPSGPSPYPITAGASCAVSVPPLLPGDQVCATYSVSPTGSTADNVGTVIAANGGIVASGPQCSSPVVNEPYFKVFGGDISAGSTFATTTVAGATTCSSNPINNNSGVYGWNTAGGGGIYQPYAGAGAQFGVAALGIIQGVASNQNNPNASPYAMPTVGSSRSDPTGLSFANSSANAAGGNFGGYLGAASCLPDYYASKPSSAQPLAGPSLTGISGSYSLASGATINASTIVPGQHLIVYAAGSVYINGDINFGGGSYASVDQIPSLVLVAKGDIYISSTVKTLSGIFIAQPVNPKAATVTDGTIYDCAFGVSLPVPSSSIYDNCGTQLTINGSFIANRVILMRTGNASNDKIASSLRRSAPNETNNSTNAAEIFNYSPAFWMNISLPQSSTSSSTNSASYDSIISLPPIL